MMKRRVVVSYPIDIGFEKIEPHSHIGHNRRHLVYVELYVSTVSQPVLKNEGWFKKYFTIT